MCMIASSRWLMVVSRLAKGWSKIQESLRRLLWPCQKWLWNANVHHPRHRKGPRTGTVVARAAPTERTDSIGPPASTEDLVRIQERRATDCQWISLQRQINGMTMNDRHCVEAKPPWFYRSSWCPSGWQDLCYITFQFWLAWPRKNEEQ